MKARFSHGARGEEAPGGIHPVHPASTVRGERRAVSPAATGTHFILTSLKAGGTVCQTGLGHASQTHTAAQALLHYDIHFASILFGVQIQLQYIAWNKGCWLG